jgi:hypothetical protein
MASADEMADQMCPMHVLARRAPDGPKAEPGAAPGRGGMQQSRLDTRTARLGRARCLFVPRPSGGVDHQRCVMDDLGTTRQRNGS